MGDEGKANAEEEPQEVDNPSPADSRTESADDDHPEPDEDGGDSDAPPENAPPENAPPENAPPESAAPQDAPPQDAPGIPPRQDAEIPSGKVARTTTTERTWDQDPTAEPDAERGAVSDARARERGLLEGHPEDRGADESSEMEPDEG